MSGCPQFHFSCDNSSCNISCFGGKDNTQQPQPPHDVHKQPATTEHTPHNPPSSQVMSPQPAPAPSPPCRGHNEHVVPHQQPPATPATSAVIAPTDQRRPTSLYVDKDVDQVPPSPAAAPPAPAKAPVVITPPSLPPERASTAAELPTPYGHVAATTQPHHNVSVPHKNHLGPPVVVAPPPLPQERASTPAVFPTSYGCVAATTQPHHNAPVPQKNHLASQVTRPPATRHDEETRKPMVQDNWRAHHEHC